MNIDSIHMERCDVQKLLGIADADVALLYIYLKAGNAVSEAEKELHLSGERIRYAGALLQQLGLCAGKDPKSILPEEQPNYSLQDVVDASKTDTSFLGLCNEIEKQLGRAIYPEDRRIVLTWINHLGLSSDMIINLISYCKKRDQLRGKIKFPALRDINKEAYRWSEEGIDTYEQVAARLRAMEMHFSQMHKLMDILQIRGRNLTAAEEKYANSWLEMGFEDEVISMAYERTCLNTGGLNWAYMNKILQRWHEAGLHTAEEVRNGDRKPVAAAAGRQRQLDADEIAAIQRMMKGE